MTNIGIKLIHPNAVMPKAAHAGDADDLYATEEVILRPNVPALIRTGLVIDLPEGWRAWITPRGGLALKHGVTVANAPGLIDAGYRGEVCVILAWNGHNANFFTWEDEAIDAEEYRLNVETARTLYGQRNRTTEQETFLKALKESNGLFRIAPGDRVAQISFAPIYPTALVQTDEVSSTDRGTGGFGSTGL